MASAELDSQQRPVAPNSRGLIPSDQLLAIFAVNVILLAWGWLSFSVFYSPHPPNLPNWIYWGGGFILIASLVLAVAEDLWPRLKRIAEGADASNADDADSSTT